MTVLAVDVELGFLNPRFPLYPTPTVRLSLVAGTKAGISSEGGRSQRELRYSGIMEPGSAGDLPFVRVLTSLSHEEVHTDLTVMLPLQGSVGKGQPEKLDEFVLSDRTIRDGSLGCREGGSR